MKKLSLKLSAAVFILACMFFCSCNTAPHVYSDLYNESEISITDAVLDRIKFDPPTIELNANGRLTRFQLPMVYADRTWYNALLNPAFYAVAYRVEWFDDKGFSLATPAERAKPTYTALELKYGEKYYLVIPASKNEAANSFKLYIKAL